MKPERLAYTRELLRAYGAFEPDNALLVEPRLATEAEIGSYHTPDYIDAVRTYGRGEVPADAHLFNFGPGDNPAYRGVFDASALSTGASLVAAELLMSGEAEAAISVSGGLHHAMPGYAYGFCVFNDPVVAIKSMVAKGLRVAYVDIDCHHGDGVQNAFYDTDRVMTISLHESGNYLFPGTGWVQETGAGRGRGYSVNLPLYPYTTPDTYLWVFEEVVPPLIERFAPDILVTQLGIDTHYRDPITHLAQTVQGFSDVVRAFSKMPYPWLALGGGGYDLQAVARCWAQAFAIMSGQELAPEIPEPYASNHGIESLYDPDDLPITDEVRREARTYAEGGVQALHGLIFPMHGIRSA
jgi:acetoin utilization protein AcuC